MGPGTRFVAQHDARFGPGGAISIYDTPGDLAEALDGTDLA